MEALMEDPRIPWVIYIPPMLWQYWYWQAGCWYWVRNDAIKTGAILLLLARKRPLPPLPFWEANMIWKQCREIRREPTRNKGIHLVISMSFLVHLLMQFIRGRNCTFVGGSHIYINLSCMRRSMFCSNHKVRRHNSPCNKPLSRVLCFA